MNEIPLLGLPSDRIGAAIATFGLYHILPGCEISFRRVDGGFIPVVYTTKVKDVTDLAAKLVDYKTTWKAFLPVEIQPEAGCDAIKQQVLLETYQHMAKYDSRWAHAIATDQVTDKNKNHIGCIGKTPLFMVFRGASLTGNIQEWRKQLDVESVISVLSNPHWKPIGGQTLGIFPEYEKGTAFRKRNEKTSTVPILCLLAVASWLNFPCYRRGNGVSIPGWENDSFSYPVFERRMDQQTFASLMLNLSYVTKFKGSGVSAVYQSKKIEKPKSYILSRPFRIM